MSRESIFNVLFFFDIFYDIILFTQTFKLRLLKYFFVCLINILFHCVVVFSFTFSVVPSQLGFHHFHKLFYYTNIKVKSWHFKYVIHYICSIHSLTVRLFLYNILIYIIVYEIKHLVSLCFFLGGILMVLLLTQHHNQNSFVCCWVFHFSFFILFIFFVCSSWLWFNSFVHVIFIFYFLNMRKYEKYKQGHNNNIKYFTMNCRM